MALISQTDRRRVQNKKAAYDAMTRASADHQHGRLTAPDRGSVSKYAKYAERWLSRQWHVRPLRPRSVTLYRSELNYPLEHIESCASAM